MGKRAATRGRTKSAASRSPIEPLENRILMSTTATPPVVNINWGGTTIPAVQGQYLTEVRNSALFSSLVTKEGFTDLKSLGGGFYQFTSTLPVDTIRKLGLSVPRTVKTIEPNEQQHIDDTIPDDPMLSQQWGVDNTGQLEPFDYNRDGVVTPYNYVQNPVPPTNIEFPSPPYPNENQYGLVGDDVDLTKAWDITTGSPDVVVADIDSGVDITHPDLINNIWTNPLDTAANNDDGDGYPGDINGYNFVDNSDDVMDPNGHGTIDAGIIGASGNNGIGVTGVNWNVKILPVVASDVNGSLTLAAELASLVYITTLKDDGINIVAANESFGGDEFPNEVLQADATAEAGKAGILIVVAAGNSAQNVDRQFTEPSKFSVADPNVITVAAVDNQFNLAAFSNFGADTVDLAAPGINIYNTTPTYAVTLNTEIAGEPDIPQFTEDYGYSSGTSQATPTVTGIIALEAAANPAASPAQLKAALLDGVTYDPALAASNGSPRKVLTSGVANAYNAVMDVLNPFVATNTVRQGSWTNFYGSQGAYVVGESTSFPSFVTVTQSGGSPVILADTTKNLAAPERVSDPTTRISAYEAAASSESISLDFTDGQSHQVELYLADLDNKKRVETASIIDTATGAVLNAQTVGAFTKGQYLTWSLQGNVTIRLTADAGPSVVYSGLFFDPPATKPTTLLGTSTATTGYNWRNQYGSQGAVIAGDTTSLPSYVSAFSVLGETGQILKGATTASVSLQKLDNVNTGIEAAFTSGTSMDFNLATNDGLLHDVTFYVADYKNKKLSERFQVIDSLTGDILATQDVANFSKGQFVSFSITGAVTFRVINTGPVAAAVSGIFFDAPFGENASFVGTDTTTRGNWKDSLYGLNTAYIVGDNFPGVDDTLNPSISISGGTRKIVAVPSSDPTALIKTEAVNSKVRVAAYIYTTTSMTLDYNPGDLGQHTIALYFADYENDKRTESVTLYNGTTNLVLSHQVISNFRKGKYLVFDVTGPILITINSGTYPNAVLSGVFTT
jgi:subtilisin family serine protease